MAIKQSSVASVLQALSSECSTPTTRLEAHTNNILRDLAATGFEPPPSHCAILSARAAGRVMKTRGVSHLELSYADYALNEYSADCQLREAVVHELLTQERLDLSARREWLKKMVYRLQGVCGVIVLGLTLRLLVVWFVGNTGPTLS
eukprot:TRINITY_DN19561_c0_g2_i1.p1 TRINITY_DN19561_c0_g2~~TRINITY_DN19561_c0_g2_i1.p1  ORF type:complete len:147 (-),score=39.87 TRINITY_DN19561_c0_g2_i1:285-725(-)